MDADGAHRVVDLQVALDNVVAPDRDESAEDADQKGAEWTQRHAAGRDGNKAAEHAAHSLLRIDNTILVPAEKIARRAAGARRDHRVGDDVGDVGTGGDGRAAVEADPADKKDHRAGGRKDGIVTGDADRLAVRIVAAFACSHDPARGQRDPGAGGMHDGRAGEVDEAHVGQEGAAVRTEAGAPGPVDEDGIDDERDEDRAENVGEQAHALGDRARNDRRGGAAEHHLEDEESHLPRIEIRQQEIIAVEAEGQAAARRECEHEAGRAEGHDGEHHVEQVLLRDIDRVLRPDHAGFEQEETNLHQKDEPRRQQRPAHVEFAFESFDRQVGGCRLPRGAGKRQAGCDQSRNAAQSRDARHAAP